MTNNNSAPLKDYRCRWCSAMACEHGKLYELMSKQRIVALAMIRELYPDDTMILSPTVGRLFIGPLTLEPEWKKGLLRNKDLGLTPVEYRLLEYLATSTKPVIEHRQILKDVWGDHCVNSDQYIRVYVAGLRKKLGHKDTIMCRNRVGYYYNHPLMETLHGKAVQTTV